MYARTAMPKICTTRTPSRCLRETKAIQSKGRQLATSETKFSMAITTKDPRDGSRKGTRIVGKRRMSPVRDGLRDRPERKPIIMENYYVALNYTETLEHENDHIMVNISKKKVCIERSSCAPGRRESARNAPSA